MTARWKRPSSDGRGDTTLAEPADTAQLDLVFNDNRLASMLFGEFDQNLALLEQRLGVDIVSRGNEVTIKGSGDASRQARQTPKNARCPYRL